MRCIQTKLQCVETGAYTTAWLHGKKFNKGSVVTLDGIDGSWRVLEKGAVSDTKKLNTDWKVGGLG